MAARILIAADDPCETFDRNEFVDQVLDHVKGERSMVDPGNTDDVQACKRAEYAARRCYTVGASFPGWIKDLAEREGWKVVENA